jgi:hypothetical protein
MIQAFEYADELERDVWDFAVEVSALKSTGFSFNFLRWLVCKGYAQLAREVTASSDTTRSFQRQHKDNLALRKRTCVVLTDLGIAFVRKFVVQIEMDTEMSLRRNGNPLRLTDGTNGHDSANGHESDNGHESTNGELDRLAAAASDCKSTPTWDSDRQELRVGDRIVKEFKLHSPNQVVLLTAFEEDGWPVRIDDPLPQHGDIDPKQRLHDTIKSLNRNQKCALIRFRGDGTGQGVRWELRRASSPKLHVNGKQVTAT